MLQPKGEVGTKVRNRREALGLSLSQLADRSGMSEGAISLIERGERGTKMPLDTAVKLARGLDWPVDELIVQSVA